MNLYVQGNCAVIDDTPPSGNASVNWTPRCPYPSYYSYIGVMSLVVISMPTYIGYLGKSIMIFMLAITQCAINVNFIASSLDREDLSTKPPGPVAYPLKYSCSASLLTIACILVIISRYVSTQLCWIDNFDVIG